MMIFSNLKTSACAAALLACVAFASGAQAATTLNAENVTDYCVETYGEGAYASEPTFDSRNGPVAECVIEESGQELAMTQEIDDICTHVTGYAPWDVVFGDISCLGENAGTGSFGQDRGNNGGGSFSYN